MTIRVTLSDARPVILDDDWEMVVDVSDHNGVVKCQASVEWWIRVWRHADGRWVVGGESCRGNGGMYQGWSGCSGGYVVDDASLCGAIRAVAVEIGAESLGADAIARLPPCDLD